MTHVVRFATAMFDVSKERANPINPIAGESLLRWLAEQTRPALDVPEPSPEDWGWYSSIDWEGRAYMLGVSASDEEETREREWVLQIEKHRSVLEKLLGREKMMKVDPCAQFFQRILEREPKFRGVTADENP